MPYVRVWVCNVEWILSMILAKYVGPGKTMKVKANEVTTQRRAGMDGLTTGEVEMRNKKRESEIEEKKKICLTNCP